MPSIKVIDLRSENTIPDNLKAARAQGVIGMVHKATEGSDGVDSKAEARVFLARDAGMLTGLYHVLTDGEKVRDQVKHFVDTATALGLEDNWMLAVEAGDDVSLDDVDEFLEGVEKETRREPVLLAGALLKKKLPTRNKRLANKRLWLKQYETAAELPAGWDKYWLWQYSDGTQGEGPHVVEGINGAVGCSDFLGTDEFFAREWSGFKGLTDTGLPAAPATQPTEPGEPESGTAPAEQPTEPGEPASGTAPVEGEDADTAEHPPEATAH